MSIENTKLATQALFTNPTEEITMSNENAQSTTETSTLTNLNEENTMTDITAQPEATSETLTTPTKEIIMITETLTNPTEEITMNNVTPLEAPTDTTPDSVDTEFELTEEQKAKLAPIVDSMDLHLEKAGAPRAYDAATQNEARYALGKLLIEAKKILTSKQEFGKWLQTLIKERTQFKIAVKTARRLRFLVEFGSLEECVLVGFTNVYRLMEGNYADARAEVKAHLANGYPKGGETELKNTVRKIVVDRFHELKKASTANKAATVKDLEAEIKSLRLQLAEQNQAA